MCLKPKEIILMVINIIALIIIIHHSKKIINILIPAIIFVLLLLLLINKNKTLLTIKQIFKLQENTIENILKYKTNIIFKEFIFINYNLIYLL